MNRLFATVILALIALAACGDNDDATTSTTTLTTATTTTGAAPSVTSSSEADEDVEVPSVDDLADCEDAYTDGQEMTQAEFTQAAACMRDGEVQLIPTASYDDCDDGSTFAYNELAWWQNGTVHLMGDDVGDDLVNEICFPN